MEASAAATTTTTTTTMATNTNMGSPLPARKRLAVEAASVPTTTTTTTTTSSSNSNNSSSSCAEQDIRRATVQLAEELNAFCASHTFQTFPLPCNNNNNSNNNIINSNIHSAADASLGCTTGTSTAAASVSAATATAATAAMSATINSAASATSATTSAALGVDRSTSSSNNLLQSSSSHSNNNNSSNNSNSNNSLLLLDATSDLQLQVCRKLRELLPTSNCAALLHTAQHQNWIPVLLTWLNLHDRPAVQVEALLALTNIAELCSKNSSNNNNTPLNKSYYGINCNTISSNINNNSANTNNAAAVAAAAAAAANSSKGPQLPTDWSSSTTTAAAAAAASATLQALPGSVPFPPLSFSQTLSLEAVAAFDVSLATTIQKTAFRSNNNNNNNTHHYFTNSSSSGNNNKDDDDDDDSEVEIFETAADNNLKTNAAAAALPFVGSSNHHHLSSTMTTAPLFPSVSAADYAAVVGGAVNSSIGSNTNSSVGCVGMVGSGGILGNGGASCGGGINFTSLAPPPGGAHSSVPTNAFMPPPTPVANHSGHLSFPQQLSASSQHLLLRHADAIPTLISLLGSPAKQVYEQAMWILGSIAAGDSPGGGSGGNGSSTLDGGGGGGGGGRGNSSNNNSNSSSNNNNTSGNISADNNNSKTVSARDVILAAGVMNPLLRCLEAHPNNLSLQRIGSWTLSNLLDNIFQQHQTGQSSSQSSSNNSAATVSSASSSSPSQQQQQPVPPVTNGGGGGKSGSNSNNKATTSGEYSSADEIGMAELLPVLHRLLHMTDSEVLSYICWSLSYLCDGPASHIAAVVTTPAGSKAKPGGLVPRLVELLVHPSWRVTKPALRTIGNIVCAECSDNDVGGTASVSTTTTTDYTEVILECNAVPRLKELITHSNREIQKEAAWTLSNIAAGTVDQIQAVIDSGAIAPLVSLVRDKKTDQEVRSEACWVVLNATSCGSDSQIELLVDEGCVSVLGVLMSEASMVMMALEGLERVLQVEETREMIRREQIENGELEDDEENRTPVLVSAALIENARESHNSTAVTKRADRIWKHHFVSCALCKDSFSKHRTSDASFCDECKCHVCCNCNCKIYHLDYQEELWAATEEQTEAKKNAKKSKNKKKKAKLKEKKASTKQVQEEPLTAVVSKQHSPQLSSKEQTDADKASAAGASKTNDDGKRSPSPSQCEAGEEEDDSSQNNQIDLVLYLQQTGSIIALSKLMDALEYGGDDYDDELDDYERKMIREQQMMRGQTTN